MDWDTCDGLLPWVPRCPGSRRHWTALTEIRCWSVSIHCAAGHELVDILQIFWLHSSVVLSLNLSSIMKSFPLELRQNWLKKLPRLTPSDWAIKNIELSILTLIWVDHWKIFYLEYLPVHVDTRPLHFCSATATVLCPSLPTREAWWNWKLPLSKYDVDNRTFIKQKILRLIHNWLEH